MRQRGGEQLVFAPFHGRIVIVEDPVEFAEALFEFHPHVSAQQRDMLGMREDHGLPCVGKLHQELVEKAAGAFVDHENAPEVEQQALDSVKISQDLSNQRLGGGKGQVALQLIALYGAAKLMKGA